MGTFVFAALLGVQPAGASFTLDPTGSAVFIPAVFALAGPASIQAAPAPRPFIIPRGDQPVVLDGACTLPEYRDALQAGFLDGSGVVGSIYLKHDDQNLFVCLSGDTGTDPQRFAAVYLDPDNARSPVPMPDDIALRAEIGSGKLSGLQGTGKAGEYAQAAFSGWNAQVSSSENGDQAEFQIPLSLLGCGRFGLAVLHHWVMSQANDYGWPTSQAWDQPGAWAPVALESYQRPGCPPAVPAPPTSLTPPNGGEKTSVSAPAPAPIPVSGQPPAAPAPVPTHPPVVVQPTPVPPTPVPTPAPVVTAPPPTQPAIQPAPDQNNNQDGTGNPHGGPPGHNKNHGKGKGKGGKGK